MDSEKVIKGLECHAKGARGCLFDCPYGNENGCQLLLCSDAIALLKEQEAYIEHLEEMNEKYGYINIVRCKDCRHGEPCNDGEIYCEKDIGTIETAVHKPDWFCADGEHK